MAKKKRWKYVYFIIQTSPSFQSCGFTFSRPYAEKVAEDVAQFTGKRGRIVKLSRQELTQLDYDITPLYTNSYY